MEVLGLARFLAEADVVIGQETRQQLVPGGDRIQTLKAQFLDQAILQRLVGTLDAAPSLRWGRLFACGVLAHRMSMLRACSDRPNWVIPPAFAGAGSALDGSGAIDPKDAVLVAVERDRLAMCLEILAGCLEVVEGRFRLDELQVHQAAGGVVDTESTFDYFQ